MTLEIIATCIGIASAICTGIFFLVKEYKKTELKYRKKFQKAWTNEGEIIDPVKETHYSELEVETDTEDGEITGIIDCRNLKTEEEFNNVSVNGKLKYKTAILQLSDVRHAQVVVYGKAKIKFINTKCIKWKLLKGDPNHFPKSMTMWRSNGDMSDLYNSL